ncbi:unnamed protein product [Fraxinus pennsylvanica]|uniref:J domain-containing protein n=1 Tax=Fraxinus pennsylvanica TaxID=56036 RepID=A0AAD1ZAX1_9LAMI|nr:unnamed protein product [Fraxinus pennsylvanica]
MVYWEERKYPFAVVNFAICKAYPFSIMVIPFMGDKFLLLYMGLPTHQPMPLVDLIEANSVKRSYQKALLCLHPDKLQQKGVASHRKYIAEKVFDILQEAWVHFNAIGL